MSGASDLLLHLRPRPLEVDFLGISYTIPAMDAVGWLELVNRDMDPWKVFPGLAGTDALDAATDALWAGHIETDEVVKLAMEVVSTVGDRPWWETIRIIDVATDAWEIVHVNNASSMAFAGWLDEVWSRMLATVDPKKRASFIGSIQEVPKGWESQVDFTGEERAFLAAMNSVMK